MLTVTLNKLIMIKQVIRVAMIAMLSICVSTAASAQLKFGPRLGVDISDFSFKNENGNVVTTSGNGAGFVGGFSLEYMFPKNLGFDVSLLYVHRSSKLDFTDSYGRTDDNRKITHDYFQIPLNFKYKLAIPAVRKIIAPYAFTGPEIMIGLANSGLADKYEMHNFGFAWNVGLGVELFSHLQVSASYSHGLSTTIDRRISVASNDVVSGKSHFWSVTAAWMF